MNKPIEHKHLIVRAEVDNPPTDPEYIKKWVATLVKKIGMKLLPLPANPIAGYVDTPGNRGATCVAIIETSHVALHVWDEARPALFQLDVYTCSALELIDVFDHMTEFGVRSKSVLFIDRERGIKKVL